MNKSMYQSTNGQINEEIIESVFAWTDNVRRTLNNINGFLYLGSIKIFTI